MSGYSYVSAQGVDARNDVGRKKSVADVSFLMTGADVWHSFGQMHGVRLETRS